MSAALAAPPDAATAAACRARAGEYDWEAVLPRYEAVYERVAGR
jgi:hypothetical protein